MKTLNAVRMGAVAATLALLALFVMATGPAAVAQGGGGTDSGAAQLRAGLTSLLQEHVYLAGIATGTALAGGELDPAAAALDENSVALSEAIGGVYGEDAGAAFLELWRAHIGFFVDYTVATAEGDEEGRTAAREGLDGYRADFGAFIASANPNLPADAVAEELVPHVETLFAAIDAQAEGSDEQFGLLREAAQIMPGTAEVLAGGIAAQFPQMFGPADDGGAPTPVGAPDTGLGGIAGQPVWPLALAGLGVLLVLGGVLLTRRPSSR